jgi:hypothetical protein
MPPMQVLAGALGVGVDVFRGAEGARLHAEVSAVSRGRGAFVAGPALPVCLFIWSGYDSAVG